MMDDFAVRLVVHPKTRLRKRTRAVFQSRYDNAPVDGNRLRVADSVAQYQPLHNITGRPAFDRVPRDKDS